MVQKEIECKAHISQQDFLRLHNDLDTRSSTKTAIHKSDYYYVFQNDITVRIRTVNNKKYVLTYKEKGTDSCIENSLEYETVIQDPVVLHTIFTKLQPIQCIEKIKEGYAYTLTNKDGTIPILVELIKVLGLGYFIELEITILQDTTQPIEKMRQILLSLLNELSIPYSSIETRYYIDMLQDKQQ